MKPEEVYVVPRNQLFAGATVPQGFGDEDLRGLLARIGAHGHFVPRSPAERDPSLKQIIPYLIVSHGEDVLGLRRLARQTEARLHDKFSIGVGGHINPPDVAGPDVLAEGLRRELNEELDVRADYDVALAGYINDDANEVGAVHFGLVYRVVLGNRDVAVRETELMEGRFYTLDELAALRGRIETWSQLVFDALLRPRLEMCP